MSTLQNLDDHISDIMRAADPTRLGQDLLREAVNAPLTLDDFCDLLAACQDDYAWELDDLGALRATGLVDSTFSGQPPAWWCVALFDALTAVCHARTDAYYDADAHWDRAADAIGLPLRVAAEIVSAEDADMRHDAALRARLLPIVGLEEVRHA